jgi:arginine decarboxylase
VPDIVSESGRAIVAPHSLLVVEVFERINKRESLGQQHQPKVKHKVVTDLEVMLKNKTKLGRLERFHDAIQKKEEAFSLFNLGYLDLENRAAAERSSGRSANRSPRRAEIRLPARRVARSQQAPRRPIRLQFLRFPVPARPLGAQAALPRHPAASPQRKTPVNAILVDITCDSDGKISRSSICRTRRTTSRLHPLNNKPYYLGVFLTGAYQDIMGDLHNLFGRVNEVHVFLEDDEPNGFYIEEALSGSRIADVIEGVQYQQEELCRRMKAQIDHATRKDMVKPREGVRLVELYEARCSTRPT